MDIIRCFLNANISSGLKHSHPCWEIIYRLSGKTDTLIGRQTYPLNEGDLILIPPETEHSDEPEDIFSDLVIHVDFLDFSDVLILHDYDGNVRMLMQMLHRVLLENEYNHINIANGLMEVICQYLKRLTVSVYKNPFVYKLKNSIYANMEQAEFDLTGEIEKTGFHPDYVRRCFKAETGKTPLAYLTWLRINKAKQLLVQHIGISIENIAAQCGFLDSFYFSTCFKKHTGMAPMQYRKEMILRKNHK